MSLYIGYRYWECLIGICEVEDGSNHEYQKCCEGELYVECWGPDLSPAIKSDTVHYLLYHCFLVASSF